MNHTILVITIWVQTPGAEVSRILVVSWFWHFIIFRNILKLVKICKCIDNEGMAFVKFVPIGSFNCICCIRCMRKFQEYVPSCLSIFLWIIFIDNITKL